MQDKPDGMTENYSYDRARIYEPVVRELWAETARGELVGGRNNIRAQGDPIERAVRNWISRMIGNTFRVTQGHIVDRRGRKSRQMDVIVVRDTPSATMWMPREEEAELVRVEWVAAVGEVKKNLGRGRREIDAYAKRVTEIREMQRPILRKNMIRFGDEEAEGFADASWQEIALMPISGQEWWNEAYTFLLAVENEGRVRSSLGEELTKAGVEPRCGAALVLDKSMGGFLAVPEGTVKGKAMMGRNADIQREPNDLEVKVWRTLSDPDNPCITSAARLTGFFIADLQNHLEHWLRGGTRATQYTTIEGCHKH